MAQHGQEGTSTSEVTPATESEGTSVAVPAREGFFGHPRGLATLFFTELWERFSYYGMRALLVLFMTAGLTGANPGLGFSVGKATALYGLYTFFVYVLSLPGGWVADNIWGQRRSVFVGGCIIALGHFTMAGPLVGLPEQGSFFIGLILIVIGTGLLKPNVSSMVGDLYPEGGARRDAGFSIFYMGINLGAILGPLLCGFLGEGFAIGGVSFEGNWHWGFSLAGFGMLVGLIAYQFGYRYLGRAGELKVDVSPQELSQRSRNFYLVAAGTAAFIVVFGFLMSSGVIGLSLEQLAGILGTSVALIAVVFFTYLINGTKWVGGVLLFALLAFFAALPFIEYASFVEAVQLEMQQAIEAGDLAAPYPDATVQGQASMRYYLFAYQVGIGVTVLAFLLGNAVRMFTPSLKVSLEKKRLYVIFWLFLLAALFWSGFEQAGSSFNLFAQDLTDRSIMGTIVPASTLQLINPLFIVLLAPVFGWAWTWLASRNANPSIPVKFGLGLFGLAAGFFVLSWGAANASPETPVSPSWLVVTYFLHTCGELCLSPVGLSSMTKLAPENRVSQMMGVWFVAAALGNLFAGLLAGQLEQLAPSGLFSAVAFIIGGGGVVALLASPVVKRLMGDVE